MNTDHFDRNITHIFLREEIGGQGPPDLSREILARAGGGDAPAGESPAPSGLAIRRWWEVPAAVAATILIGFIIWAATLSRYPRIEASGQYTLVSGDKVERGATICTKASTASLALGGYCRVDICPWTTLRIAGRDGAEAVFVEKGTVVCNVDSNVGKFSVSTEFGTVLVTGTEFTVRLADDGGYKKMRVSVTAGSVEVSDGWDSQTLAAGQEWTSGQGAPDLPEPGDGRRIGTEEIPDRRGKPSTGDGAAGDDQPMTSEADPDVVLERRIGLLDARIKEAVELIGTLRQQSAEMRKALEARRARGRGPSTRPAGTPPAGKTPGPGERANDAMRSSFNLPCPSERFIISRVRGSVDNGRYRTRPGALDSIETVW